MSKAKTAGAEEIEIMGKKFKTIPYLQRKLRGRYDGTPIHEKTISKYLAKGMPHFTWGKMVLFSNKDLAAIPDWIAENCRKSR